MMTLQHPKVVGSCRLPRALLDSQCAFSKELSPVLPRLTTKLVPWRPLLPRTPHCSPAGRGEVSTLFWEFFADSHPPQEETLTLPTCPRTQGDSNPCLLYACLDSSLCGASMSPLRELRSSAHLTSEMRGLGDAQPTPDSQPHIQAPMQVSCSDASAGQAGSRGVKDTPRDPHTEKPKVAQAHRRARGSPL